MGGLGAEAMILACADCPHRPTVKPRAVLPPGELPVAINVSAVRSRTDRCRRLLEHPETEWYQILAAAWDHVSDRERESFMASRGYVRPRPRKKHVRRAEVPA